MRCRWRRLLWTAIDEELSGTEQQRWESHLKQCSWCAAEWEEAQRLQAALGSLQEVDPPQWLGSQIAAGIADYVTQPRGCLEYRGLLDRRVDENLSPELQEAVVDHLKQCTACAAYDRELSGYRELLHHLEPLEPPVSLVHMIHRRVGELERTKGGGGDTAIWWRGSLAGLLRPAHRWAWVGAASILLLMALWRLPPALSPAGERLQTASGLVVAQAGDSVLALQSDHIPTPPIPLGRAGGSSPGAEEAAPVRIPSAVSERSSVQDNRSSLRLADRPSTALAFRAPATSVRPTAGGSQGGNPSLSGVELSSSSPPPEARGSLPGEAVVSAQPIEAIEPHLGMAPSGNPATSEDLGIVSSPEAAAVLFSAAFINTRITGPVTTSPSSAEAEIHQSVAGVTPTIEELSPESLGPQRDNKYPGVPQDAIAPLVGSLFWDAKQGPPPALPADERLATGLFETRI